jgi:AI-2 transport protein TqsA
MPVERLRQEQTWLAVGSLVVIAAVALGAALAYTRALTMPFVLAVFLSYLVAPLVDTLRIRLRLPRWLAVTVAFLAVVALVTALGLLVATSVGLILDTADDYRASLRQLARDIFTLLGIDLGRQPVMTAIRNLPLLEIAGAAAGTAFDLTAGLTLVTIFVLFLLAGRHPRRARVGLYGEIDRAVRRYVVTKFLVSSATGLLVGLILWGLGLELALVFGVLAFLLNFIPNIGSVVATLLPLPLAVAQFDSAWRIAAVLVLPGVVQMVMGNGVEPFYQGEGLDLHPVTVLLALGIWGILWGVPGMFLAAPITAVLRIVLARFETTRPAAEALAGRFGPARRPAPAAEMGV